MGGEAKLGCMKLGRDSDLSDSREAAGKRSAIQDLRRCGKSWPRRGGRRIVTAQAPPTAAAAIPTTPPTAPRDAAWSETARRCAASRPC